MSDNFIFNQLQEITINLKGAQLFGNLYIPENSQGLVVFAHGSGSSRMSPRNQFVAESLNKLNLATLLFDLLTAEEDVIDNLTREFRFDIPLLADRLVGVTDWLLQQSITQSLNIGYFGASTGAGAALIAAAARPDVVKAVVSRGGRPDLADEALKDVEAPTLLIVGGLDTTVIELNKQAQAQMKAQTELAIVPGATHLFEEPGTLEKVNDLAGKWLCRYLITSSFN